MASSGITALLLQGGRTVHSRLKVPIRLNEISMCGISKQTVLAKLIQRANLLVWDEAPMTHRFAAECIDRSLRDLCSCDLPFGGKVIVFGGDFRQILPVVRHGTQADVSSACLNRSPLWRFVQVLKLTINMRLKSLSLQDSAEVRKFSDFLLRVGEGTEPENENHMIHLDQRFEVPGGSAADLVTAVYGDIRQYYNDAEYINRRILMCPKNDTTDFINEYVINQIPGEGKTLLSADSVPDDQAALYPTEFRGKRVFIPPIPMTPTDTDFPFVLRRRQFPIRPAFCITINKGQGQSMENVGIFLPSPEAIFSHGQLYVALSRVHNPNGLKVMVCGGSTSSSGGVWVRNVVYREVFQNHLEYVLPSTQDTSFMDISFPCSPLTQQSDMDESVFTLVKRKFESNNSDQSSKFPKLTESIDNDISINLDSQCIPSLPNNNSPDLLFNGFITGPVDMTRDLLLASINNLTIPMRMRIASCIGLESEPILINREISNRIFGAKLHQYYYSLENRLANKFQHNIFLIPVIADGSCLFRALSHIIFGTESKYESFKHHLIAKFRSSPFHFFNEMNKLGLTELAFQLLTSGVLI